MTHYVRPFLLAEAGLKTSSPAQFAPRREVSAAHAALFSLDVALRYLAARRTTARLLQFPLKPGLLETSG